MKTLYLLRHAKSSWHDPALDDFDRPLNPRGLRTAPLIGSYMAGKAYLPGIVLCSSSRRTLETLSLIKPHIGLDLPTQVEDVLYLASTGTLLSVIREIGDKYDSALIIGHNPGLEDCLATLAREQPAEAVPAMPTAALAVLTFDTDSWVNILEGTGRLEDFTTPKSLTGVDQD